MFKIGETINSGQTSLSEAFTQPLSLPTITSTLRLCSSADKSTKA